MRTTQRKGDIAVSQAIASFTKMGLDVSIPLTESASYDLILDVNNKLKRIQVKFCSGKHVDLRRIHSNSKGYVVKKVQNHVYDWLYVLKLDGSEYLIKKCLINRRAIKLTDEYLLKKAMEK